MTTYRTSLSFNDLRTTRWRGSTRGSHLPGEAHERGEMSVALLDAHPREAIQRRLADVGAFLLIGSRMKSFPILLATSEL
jgi:hypothetical protein